MNWSLRQLSKSKPADRGVAHNFSGNVKTVCHAVNILVRINVRFNPILRLLDTLLESYHKNAKDDCNPSKELLSSGHGIKKDIGPQYGSHWTKGQYDGMNTYFHASEYQIK